MSELPPLAPVVEAPVVDPNAKSPEQATAKAGTQGFTFTKTEIEEAYRVAKNTGSPLCGIIHWANRRRCKKDAKQVDEIARILCQVIQHGSVDTFYAWLANLEKELKPHVKKFDEPAQTKVP